MAKKIAMLTGGGDCPGLNPVIRAITRKGLKEGYEILGVKCGWRGMIDKEVVPLTRREVSGIVHRGGTILGTSRTNPRKMEGAIDRIFRNFKDLELEALIAIGGDDTLGVAHELFKKGLNTIGVPKTIDNDLPGTDYTFGFDTAVNIAMEAIDRLHTTAESHHRVLVVEIMGRHAGWITLQAGMAGGADYVLIPEFRVDLDEVATTIKRRHEGGTTFSIIAVAEGFKLGDRDVTQSGEVDSFGHVRLGGIGEQVARELERRTGYETRNVVLGHVQRGGSPTAFDRVLGTRLGLKAVELVKARQFGKMVALQGTQIVALDIETVTQQKLVSQALYDEAKVFFG
ncbi:MAG: 6-phosphofructokinase [Verrucomicrobiae bacterium]|nr:6-phosphofructokinase [Verrucomicrobiae bacterium]